MSFPLSIQYKEILELQIAPPEKELSRGNWTLNGICGQVVRLALLLVSAVACPALGNLAVISVTLLL